MFYKILFLLLIASQMIPADESTDRKSSVTDPSEIHFFWKEKMKFIGSDQATDEFYLNNQLYFSYQKTIRFYRFELRVEDLFSADFASIGYDQSAGITDPSVIVRDVLFHSLSAGFDQRFRSAGIMDFYLNLGAGLNTPLNDYPYLTLYPGLRLAGSYYFGLDWEISLDLPSDIYPAYGFMVFYPAVFISMDYEFFRFYGPQNFRMTLLTENTFSPEYDSSSGILTGSDQFKTGISFSFYGLSLSAAFSYRTECQFNPLFINTNRPGFSTGVQYRYRYFTISAEYSGAYDTIDGQWFHGADVSIRLSFEKPL